MNDEKPGDEHGGVSDVSGWTTYRNASPWEVPTLEQIYATAAKMKAMSPIESDITVSPDLLEAARRAVDATSSVLMPTLRIHVDNRLPTRTWHKGRPAEPTAISHVFSPVDVVLTDTAERGMTDALRGVTIRSLDTTTAGMRWFGSSASYPVEDIRAMANALFGQPITHMNRAAWDAFLALPSRRQSEHEFNRNAFRKLPSMPRHIGYAVGVDYASPSVPHDAKTKHGRAPRSTKPDRNARARAKVLAKGPK